MIIIMKNQMKRFLKKKRVNLKSLRLKNLNLQHLKLNKKTFGGLVTVVSNQSNLVKHDMIAKSVKILHFVSHALSKTSLTPIRSKRRKWSQNFNPQRMQISWFQKHLKSVFNVIQRSQVLNTLIEKMSNMCVRNVKRDIHINYQKWSRIRTYWLLLMKSLKNPFQSSILITFKDLKIK